MIKLVEVLTKEKSNLYPGPWPPEDIYVLVWGRGGGKGDKRIIHGYSQPWTHTPTRRLVLPAASMSLWAQTHRLPETSSLGALAKMINTDMVSRSICLKPVLSITIPRGWLWRQPPSQSCFLMFPCLVARCTSHSLQRMRLSQAITLWLLGTDGPAS